MTSTGAEMTEPTFDQPVPQRPKHTAVIVLSILLVLLVGGAASFGVLYFTEKEHSKTVAEQQKKDLAAAFGRQNAAEAALRDERALRESQNETPSNCRYAARALREAIIGKDQKKVEATLTTLFEKC